MRMRPLLLVLATLVLACGQAPCPEGTRSAQSCAECGPTDACLRVQTSCLPTCPTGVCASGGLCLDGVCKAIVCG
mgnify:CR=1 FL=1